MSPEDKLYDNLHSWDVPIEYAHEIVRYLVRGYPPGSFHTSLFANNLYDCASHSHSANKWIDIIHTSKWIVNTLINEAFGTYEKVSTWLKQTPEYRIKRLEEVGLIFSMWDILKYTGKEIPLKYYPN